MRERNAKRPAERENVVAEGWLIHGEHRRGSGRLGEGSDAVEQPGLEHLCGAWFGKCRAGRVCQHDAACQAVDPRVDLASRWQLRRLGDSRATAVDYRDSDCCAQGTVLDN